MNIIAAIDNQNAIGYKNNLIYNIKADKEYFKKLTTNKIIIMGRKTFESLPNKKPLPNRTNIILTRNKNYKAENCIIFHSKEDLFLFLDKNNIDTDSVFIIGGSEIYKLFIKDCSVFYITEIMTNKKEKANVFFPVNFRQSPLSASEWKDFENGRYRFVIYGQQNIPQS